MAGAVHSRKLPRNVVLAGLTSFFTDVSSEMVYPLLQAFVAMILTAHKAMLGPVLGVVEGLAESTASLSKVAVGYYSDRIRRRKEAAIAGYGLSAAAKGLLLAASLGWWFVLASRFLDRIGKGVRTAPRDALIAESTPPDAAGRAFGFHRAMDFAGATVGVLLCWLVSVQWLDPVTGNLRTLDGFYWLFGISMVPAVAGVGFLFLIRERAAEPMPGAASERPRPNLDVRRYRAELRWFFLAQALFTLGNSSNQFLLLRSMTLGNALSTVILMYMVFNLSSSLLSTYFGSLSDRIGRRRVLIWGYVLYSVVYAAFGFVTPEHGFLLWLFWAAYGVYYAMTEGVEKAFVSRTAPEGSRATALGLYHTLVGVGLFPASLVAGFLFSFWEPAPFLFGGAMSLAAAAVMVLRVREGALGTSARDVG